MVQPLGTQFPMEGMIGPNSELGRISAKTSMFNPAEGKGYEKLLNVLRQAEAEVAPDFRANVRSALPAGMTIGSAASKAAGNIAGKYLPIAGAGLSLLQGDVGGAVGGLGGMALGSLLGPVGALGGSVVGGMLGTAAQKGIGGVIQGAQGIVDTVTGQRREEGKSGLTGKGVGYSDEDIRMIEQLASIQGRLPVDAARQMLPIQNQYENAQLGRTMQQAQQNAQLRGALDRQLQIAQLTQGAQTEAGATVRSILNSSNPYAAATFRG